MNALFTRNFGVFRAFLFFPNCKTRDEPPWVAEGDMTVLKPGMIISDEPGLYVPGFGGFRHSDTLLITEDGCRRLTKYPRELEACIIPVK